MLASQSDDLFDALLRLQAFRELHRSAPAFAAFLEVLKRCLGQVDLSLVPHINKDKLEAPSEKNLLLSLESAEKLGLIHLFGHFSKGRFIAIRKKQDPQDRLRRQDGLTGGAISYTLILSCRRRRSYLSCFFSHSAKSCDRTFCLQR